jgi:hypothetical protein
MHTTNAKIYVSDGDTVSSHVNWDGTEATVHYYGDTVIPSPLKLRALWGRDAILELQPLSPALYGTEEKDERADLLAWLKAQGWPVREVTT